MPEKELEVVLVAFRKMGIGESITINDFDRIINFFNTVPIQISQPNVDEVQGRFAMWRQVLNERYVAVKQ